MERPLDGCLSDEDSARRVSGKTWVDVAHGPESRTSRRRLRRLGVMIAATLVTVASPALAAAAGVEAQPPPPVAPAPAPASASDMAAPFDDEAPAQYDPWQGLNRRIFAFNMGLDRLVLGPVTHAYIRVAPLPIRRRIGAVVYNLGEPRTALNDAVQGHGRRAATSASRFVVNSTIGLLGLFDVGADFGLAAHSADFGQTLGRYGTRPGPYLYVPLVGPLDLRDGFGRIVDLLTDPVSLLAGGMTTTFGATRTGVSQLDRRANGDGAIRALDDATDPYVTTRSAYTQNRAFMVQSASGKAATLPDFDATPAKP